MENKEYDEVIDFRYNKDTIDNSDEIEVSLGGGNNNNMDDLEGNLETNYGGFYKKDHKSKELSPKKSRNKQ